MEHEIDVYNFPTYEGQQSLIPFAVVGSNVVVQDENGEDHDEPDVINDWWIIEIKERKLEEEDILGAL